MNKITQKLPYEEIQKLQPSNKPAPEWAQQFRDLGGFMKSVWYNPYITDVQWHEDNARRLQRGRGRKPTWFELALMGPKLRKLYTRR